MYILSLFIVDGYTKEYKIMMIILITDHNNVPALIKY